MYEGLKWYEKVVEYREQALTLFRELQDRQGEGITRHSLCSAYSSLGWYEKAIDCNQQVLAIMQELKSQIGAESTLHNLGNNYLRLGVFEKAIEYLEQSLALYRNRKDPLTEASLLNKLGVAHANLGRKEQASKYFEQALSIYQERVTSGAKRHLYSVGLMQQRLGRNEEAAASYLEDAAFWRDTGDKANESRAHAALARLERERDNLRQALTHIEESLRLAESLRAGFVGPEARAAFLVALQDSYLLYSDLLTDLHQREPQPELAARALEANERRRARSLLDLLAEALMCGRAWTPHCSHRSACWDND